MHIFADVQRITLNALYITISGGRTKQLDIFCRVTGFTSDFLSFRVVNLFSSFTEPFNWYLHKLGRPCVRQRSYFSLWAYGLGTRDKHPTYNPVENDHITLVPFPWVGLGPTAHRYQYHQKNLCRMLQ